jgi:lipopolysaccharide transport system ATP-binding protein
LGEAARITQISLNEGSSVKSWDTLVVDFEVLVQRNVGEASFGIGFSMVDGTRLLTLDSDLSGMRIPLYAGTTKSARLVLQSLPLEPATYMIDIGIRSGNSHQVDYLGSVFAVAIQSGENTPAFLVDNRSPGIRLAAEWTL